MSRAKWLPADTECWRLGRGELASVGELLRSYHDCVAGFAPGTGFEEGPQAVAAGQVVCHGDIAPRNTVFADGRATAFIDWDGIFVSTPMWDLAHAVWQFALVCDDADRWLGGWSSRRAAPPACRLLRRRWQFRHAHLSLVVEIGLYAVTKLASHRNQLDRSAGLPLRSWR